MDGNHHRHLEESPALKIRKLHRNLSESIEGTGESISGLNSSSSCHMTQVRMRGGMKRQLFSLAHQFLFFEEGFIDSQNKEGGGEGSHHQTEK
jgi:hypothetical protein